MNAKMVAMLCDGLRAVVGVIWWGAILVMLIAAHVVNQLLAGAR